MPEPNVRRGALSSYKTKSEYIYQDLRQAILKGEYPPGSRIVVDTVADEYGVSKVPVREAILRLAGEGWIDVTAHVGAVVPELSPGEIWETALVRSVVEGLVGRLAAEYLTAADTDVLRQLLARMDVLAGAASIEYVQCNLDFHQAMAASIPYALLRDLTKTLGEKAMRLRTVHFLPNYSEQSQVEHWAILHALEQRDGEAAERLCRVHVESAGRLLSEFAERREQRTEGT